MSKLGAICTVTIMGAMLGASISQYDVHSYSVSKSNSITVPNLLSDSLENISIIENSTPIVKSSSEEEQQQLKERQSLSNVASSKSKLINADLANTLGLSDSSNKNVTAYSIVIGEQLSGLDMTILSTDSVGELEDKYKNLSVIAVDSLSDAKSNNIINLSDGDYSIKETGLETSKMVATRNMKVYARADKNSTVLRELKPEDRIIITNIEKNGYALLHGDTDEWVLKEYLCTESEAKKVKQGKALLEIANPDVNYNGGIVKVTGAERELLERLVMGEAGAEGYEGACLVAQTIRDYMLFRGFDSVEQVRVQCKYTGSLKREPNSDVKRAVAFIFDQGGYAVRHEIYYFYAFKWSTSKWHETQEFIIQHNGHRVFDRKG